MSGSADSSASDTPSSDSPADDSPADDSPSSDSPASDSPAADTLPAALRRHGLELPADQIAQLERYCRLLWDWNRQLNLTRHTDFDKFVGRDLVDSLQLAAWLGQGEEVLDLGSGGGVPGIVLAIVRPDLDVALCESVEKKARVLNDLVRQLDLPVAVHHVRVEELLEDLRFDAVVARAVGPLWKICHWLQPHWDSVGRVLLVKGPAWVEERNEARHRGLLRLVELRRVASYPLVGTSSQSVILKLWRKGRPEPQVRGEGIAS
ncbi:MAG: 16S rRNA (guanine(527)-N(7))-methyltransferase RsmG [Pirellulaceae bacterium]|nr:16S rRNA (guanine(527)-N(7))-methyltransferase RsmG [Pirellulaceae bacterium]